MTSAKIIRALRDCVKATQFLPADMEMSGIENNLMWQAATELERLSRENTEMWKVVEAANQVWPEGVGLKYENGYLHVPVLDLNNLRGALKSIKALQTLDGKVS
jgi:hypothetical protein